MPPFRLYLITDRRLTPDLARAVEHALSTIPPGAAAIQLREKDLTTREILILFHRLAPICRRYETKLLINDRIDIALSAGADGVHLSGSSVSATDARSLLPKETLIGISCHEKEELVLRSPDADFAVVGPIDETPGKLRPGMGSEGFSKICTESPLPLFALGGVSEKNAPCLMKAGAYGVAAIRAWLATKEGTERLFRSIS